MAYKQQQQQQKQKKRVLTMFSQMLGIWIISSIA